MRRGFLALSGDPITFGHLWVIERGMDMCDEFLVALAINRAKKHDFTIEDRKAMLSESIKDRNKLKITEIAATETTVRAAQRAGAQYLIRGVRNAADFEYEMAMARFNAKVVPEIFTIFVPTPPCYADLSSSFVKGLVGLEDWEKMVQDCVPQPVLKRLREWHQKKGL